MQTTITVNGDRISEICGNRGGIHKSVAYAGVDAIRKALGLSEDTGIFGDDDSLRICRWQYATGTYRAEPIETLYDVAIIRDDTATSTVAVAGDHREACLAGCLASLAENADRIQRRGR